jgi:transitional endoplasmic reticulum ATPase
MDGERDVAMDDILNVIDGIDTKSANIITVLTTNNLDGIHAAMLRPGRLDAVINVLPPDDVAVQKLLRSYGGDTIAADADLTRVGHILAGAIPAVIAEVIKRAKLSQLKLNKPGDPVLEITALALEDAAETMNFQQELLDAAARPAKPKAELTEALQSAVRQVLAEQEDEIETIVQRAVADL